MIEDVILNSFILCSKFKFVFFVLFCVCVCTLLYSTCRSYCVFTDLFQSSAGEGGRQNTTDSPPVIIFNNRHSVIQRTVQTKVLYTHTHHRHITQPSHTQYLNILHVLLFSFSISDVWLWLHPSVGEERVTFFHQDGFEDGQIQNTQNRLPRIINSVKKIYNHQ